MQDHLAAAFGSASHPQAARAGQGASLPLENDPHSLEPHHYQDVAEAADFDRHSVLQRCFAGAALLLSALAFTFGTQTGFYALASLLLLSGAVGVFYALGKDRKTAKAQMTAATIATVSEQSHDQQWEHSERYQLMSTIHDALGDLVVARTLDGRIIHANATFRAIVDIDQPEGMTCEQTGIHFKPGQQKNAYDVEIFTRDGSRHFSWHDVISRDPANGELLIQSIGRDVTDERLAAAQREQVANQALQASAAKSRLLSTVSHDIRTPLAGIIGMSALLAPTTLDPAQRNYLAGIDQSANALMQLVDDLLDYASIEAGRFQLRPQAESLRSVIESVVEMLSHRAHDKGIEIASHISADLPLVLKFDPYRLRQVLFNIAGNAVKFTRQGGVLVEARLERGDVVIAVVDTGPGMDEADCARIFSEFEQGGTLQDQAGGTGLGLAISARIMAAFKGTLTLDSTPGKGSTFTARFPVQTSVDGRPANCPAPVLAASRVLLLAPAGPASTALAKTVRTLGGSCQLAETLIDASRLLAEANAGQAPVTDIIVDHRCVAQYQALLTTSRDSLGGNIRRIFLVNPESRPGQIADSGFDAWLIRPLREQSLTAVLLGHMKGLERRDPINDNRPVAEPTPAADRTGTSLDIVLAEDDPVNAMLVSAMLKKSGHTVRLATDVESLLRELDEKQTSRPDLLITDMSMPGGSGAEVIAMLRSRDRLVGSDHLPVIVLTADKSGDATRDAFLSGADRVLIKPVGPAELHKSIAATMGLPDGQTLSVS